jgi:hypothetical protein
MLLFATDSGHVTDRSQKGRSLADDGLAFLFVLLLSIMAASELRLDPGGLVRIDATVKVAPSVC